MQKFPELQPLLVALFKKCVRRDYRAHVASTLCHSTSPADFEEALASLKRNCPQWFTPVREARR